MSGTGVKEGQGVTISFGTQTIILNLVDINQDGIVNTVDWGIMNKNWGVTGEE